jgi:hypothetical protein
MLACGQLGVDGPKQAAFYLAQDSDTHLETFLDQRWRRSNTEKGTKDCDIRDRRG